MRRTNLGNLTYRISNGENGAEGKINNLRKKYTFKFLSRRYLNLYFKKHSKYLSNKSQPYNISKFHEYRKKL